MVTLLEAQLKDMNPNLDSISEYACFISCLHYYLFCMFKYHFVGTDIVKRFTCIMNGWKSLMLQRKNEMR